VRASQSCRPATPKRPPPSCPPTSSRNPTPPSSTACNLRIERSRRAARGTTEDVDYTPPLTPPSETANHDKELGSKKQHSEADSESGLKQRKSNSKSKAGPSASEGEKKEAPGAGFAQSIKGTVSEQRYVPTDLDQRIAQPCECTRVFRPPVSRKN
jgi:hypothetical protein